MYMSADQALPSTIYADDLTWDLIVMAMMGVFSFHMLWRTDDSVRHPVCYVPGKYAPLA